MFTLNINTDSAFFDASHEETKGGKHYTVIAFSGSAIAQKLREVADKIDGEEFNFFAGGEIKEDIYGSTVGKWSVTL